MKLCSYHALKAQPGYTFQCCDICRSVSWKCLAQDGSPSIQGSMRQSIVYESHPRGNQMIHQMYTHGTDQCQVPRQEAPSDRPGRLSAGSTPQQHHSSGLRAGQTYRHGFQPQKSSGLSLLVMQLQCHVLRRLQVYQGHGPKTQDRVWFAEVVNSHLKKN
jgi:hypothetical protein